MGKISIANLKRTLYYLKRNGLRETWYAARERLSEGQAAPYVYVCPSGEELERQRRLAAEGLRAGAYDGIAFSIVVPAYRTDTKHLKEMITSVIKQTYPNWELIIADATEDESVRTMVEICRREAEQNHCGTAPSEGFSQCAVRYVHLPQNGGIAGNTNAALEYVRGDYVGLLDHDDLLTPDALFEVAESVRQAAQEGRRLQVLYSDEDKCNRDAAEYYDPHFKEAFNLDLVLSNNYICHFMVMERKLMQKLGFRREYEGAQDYDLVLRAVRELQVLQRPEKENLIRHIPKVLYHWRCHAASTAQNPRSKAYAYEAGLRALQDFADRSGMCAKAEHLKHLGFYRLAYLEDKTDLLTLPEKMLEARSDVGIVGGCLIRRGVIVSGRLDGAGKALYQGLSAHASGYMHRAALVQDAEAVDIRFFVVRRELWDTFEKVVGVPWQTMNETPVFAVTRLSQNTDVTAVSLRLCQAIREKGYRVVYLPDWVYWDDTKS